MMWKVPSSTISMPAKLIQPTQPDARGTSSSPYFAAACASEYSELMLMMSSPLVPATLLWLPSLPRPAPLSLTHRG